jgi:methanethiol S-methyltransferase
MFALGYAAIAYAYSVITIVYAVGFVGGFVVPRSIDGPGIATWAAALPTDVLLLALFAIQHSVMARPAFKRAWTKLIPTHIERSTYVLLSSIVLTAIFCYWVPIPGNVWAVTNSTGNFALWALFGLGWLIVFISPSMISHTDLFGIRQVLLHMRHRTYTTPRFQRRLLYKLVRHPIMLGYLIAFWATPRMTEGHLLFSIVITLYILVALQFEERDLVADMGSEYVNYQKTVPMLIPFFKRRLDNRHHGKNQ